MPSAQMIFVVPDTVEDLARLLYEHGAEGDPAGIETEEAMAEFLAGRAGTVVEAEFDSEEPVDPVHDLAEVLDRAGVRYWGTYDAFVERSRGIRVLGRAILNRTGEAGGRKEFEVPWQHGSPGIDVRTLVAAGMARPDAEATFADIVEADPRPSGPAL